MPADMDTWEVAAMFMDMAALAVGAGVGVAKTSNRSLELLDDPTACPDGVEDAFVAELKWLKSAKPWLLQNMWHETVWMTTLGEVIKL